VQDVGGSIDQATAVWLFQNLDDFVADLDDVFTNAEVVVEDIRTPVLSASLGDFQSLFAGAL